MFKPSPSLGPKLASASNQDPKIEQHSAADQEIEGFHRHQPTSRLRNLVPATFPERSAQCLLEPDAHKNRIKQALKGPRFLRRRHQAKVCGSQNAEGRLENRLCFLLLSNLGLDGVVNAEAR